MLFLDKNVTLEPNSEQQLTVKVPWTFYTELVKRVDSLPDSITGWHFFEVPPTTLVMGAREAH